MKLTDLISTYKQIVTMLVDMDEIDHGDREFFKNILKTYNKNYSNPYGIGLHEVYTFHEVPSFEDLINTMIFENLSLSFTQAIVRAMESIDNKVVAYKTKVSGKTIYVPYCGIHLILPWGPIRIAGFDGPSGVKLTETLSFEILDKYKSSSELPLDDFNCYLGVDAVSSFLKTHELDNSLNAFQREIMPYIEDREVEKVLH